MRPGARPFVENWAESTAACLITMVQGSLLVLSLGHWWLATQTGLIAALVTAAAIAITKAKRPWIISCVLGLATTLADYFTHPTHFGPFFMEAVVTGLGAAILYWVVHWIFHRERSLPGGGPKAPARTD